MPTIKAGPDRGQSLWGMIVGGVAVLMGWLAMRQPGGFGPSLFPGGMGHLGGMGVLLILIGLVVIAYNLCSLLSARPVAETEIRTDDTEPPPIPFCSACGRPLASAEYAFCPWCGQPRRQPPPGEKT